MPEGYGRQEVPRKAEGRRSEAIGHMRPFTQICRELFCCYPIKSFTFGPTQLAPLGGAGWVYLRKKDVYGRFLLQSNLANLNHLRRNGNGKRPCWVYYAREGNCTPVQL